QPTRELARRYLLEVESRVARGVIGIPAPAAHRPTAGALIERFLGEYTRPRIKDLARYRQRAGVALRRVLPVLGALRSDAIGDAEVSRLRAALQRRWAPGTVGLSLTYCKVVFGWAVRQGLVAHNPFARVELPRRSAAASFLSAEEVRSLLATADSLGAAGTVTSRGLRAAVHLAVRTGLRKGELLGLRWTDVELSSGRLTIARSFATTPKSGRPRHLRLPAEVVPILAAWQKECPKTPEGVIFPRRSRSGVWGMARGAACMAGLPRLLLMAGCRPLCHPFHALRHTFASHYIMQGGSLAALQQILGHSDLKHTMVYAHLAPEFLSAEMSRVKF
ncbi:MAG TPA: site-specific integrase, partial [Pseudomonadota bacterium]|nr:site-specific integrase [Pseudomonadota bacterium]